MANLTDIAPLAEWEQAVADGLVRRSSTADGAVHIYNYVTAAVQFKKLWSPITEASRGLVMNAATGEILARPFKKFFNFSELPPEEQAALTASSEPVLATDKLDGFLAILYTHPITGEAAIATRGSLTGAHAIAATAIYKREYAGNWTPEEGFTYLFEALMPDAGAVIKYPKEELVLIGKVEDATGRSLPLTEVSEWPWSRAEVLPYSTMGEVLAAPDRPHKEGVVVHFLHSDRRVKVKYDEFIRLHRIGEGVSRYRVWEALSNGVKMEEWKPFLEEEFYSFVDEVATELYTAYERVLAEAEAARAEVRERFGEEFERKEFAQFVNSTYRKPIAQFVLNMEFNPKGDHRARLWDQVAPKKDFKR